MSLQTWKDEFYTKPAKEVSPNDALAHSIKKWNGLTTENLTRHGLSRYGDRLNEKDQPTGFYINDQTCALCVRFISITCGDCPLAQSRNGTRCDDYREDETNSPYHAFVVNGNAKPMIEALACAEEFVKDGKWDAPEL